MTSPLVTKTMTLRISTAVTVGPSSKYGVVTAAAIVYYSVMIMETTHAEFSTFEFESRPRAGVQLALAIEWTLRR